MKRIIPFIAFVLLFVQYSLAQSSHKYSIYFAVGESSVSYQDVDEFEKQINNLPFALSNYTIHLTGHTDHIGDKKKNEILSQKRCKNIKDFLLGQDVDYDKITVEVFTNERPSFDNKIEHNRRVEILLEYFNPGQFEIATSKWFVDPSKGGEFVYKRSGSVIRIPPNALLYENGTPVKGNVEIEYKEFRDPVDFLVSGIPMVHEGKQFNSAGMFDISAKQGDQNIVFDANQMMEIDLSLSADSLENVSFFTYDKSTKEWTTIDSVDRVKGVNEYNITEAGGTRELQNINGLSLPEGTEDTLLAFRQAVRLGLHLAKTREHVINWRKNLDVSQEERWLDEKCASNGLLSKGKWYQNIAQHYRVHIHHSLPQVVSHPNKADHKKLKKDVVIWLWDWETYDARRETYRWWYAGYKQNGRKDVDREAASYKKYVRLKEQYTEKKSKLAAQQFSGNINIANRKQYLLKKKYLKVINGGYHVSQARLKAQQWLLLKKGTYKSQEIYHKIKSIGRKGKWWADYRVEHLEGENFQIILKGWRTVWDTMLVTPVLSKAQKQNPTAAYHQIVLDCQQVLQLQNVNLQDSIAQQKTNWEYLLAFSDVLRSKEQTELTQEEWLEYCSAYPLMIKMRYSYLQKELGYCKTYQDFRMRYSGNIRCGVIRDSAAIARQEIQERQAFQAGIDGMGNNIYSKVQRLRINRFTLCNIDQLFRVPPPPIPMVTYLDEKGRKVYGKRLAIINFRLNTIQYSESRRLSSVPSNSTAFYLLAKNGKRYILRPENYKKLLVKSGGVKKYIFEMEDVTNTIRTSDDLRKAFGMAT
jgi:hypothetical protein